MPAPLSHEAKFLLGILDDGQWHDLDFVKTVLASKVAPGKALRRYEERVRDREIREGPRKKGLLPDEQKIASGARMLAGVAINSMKKRYVEIDNGFPRRIRIRPEYQAERAAAREAGQDARQPASDPDDDEVTAAGSLDDGSTDDGDTEDPEDGDTGESGAQPARSCLLCGLYVTNPAQHEEFHASYGPIAAPGETAQDDGGPPAAVAFFSENQVREIVREEVAGEVGRILDAFQKGMQTWLIHRFAAVEELMAGSAGGRSSDRFSRAGRHTRSEGPSPPFRRERW